MQAVFAALCYFCENHGPRIVFTCQPMRDKEKYKNMGKNVSTNKSEPNKGGSREEDKNNDDNQDIPQFYGNIYDGGEEIVDDESRCAACSSFEHGIGIISNDHDAETSYISTQLPINERLNQILKQASLRSLSVEVSAPLHVGAGQEQQTASSSSHMNSQNGDAERDGVVLFGDDENWYTLSYTFRLKDAKARGFHRSYSMVIVCMDKLLLLRNYDFLINGLCAIVSKLQEMTSEFFVIEQEKDSDLRLASNVKGSHWLPHQFYPRQYTLDTQRSLKVITNNENIFEFMHRQMLTLLKTLSSLDKDIVLEGCPTQDMLTLMELSDSGSMEEQELVTHMSPKQRLIQLQNLRHIASRLSKINPSQLNALIWQIVIGEQIVVRSNSLAARRIFLLALLQLLPLGCIRLKTNAQQQYFPCYKFNLLGCTMHVEIPQEVQSEIFLINLLEKPQEIISSDEQIAAEKLPNLSNSNPPLFLEHFQMNFEYFPSRPEAAKPSIVSRYCRLLLDPLINEFTLESALNDTKNEWLNNAKLIFQIRHQREAIDLDRIIRIIKCKEQDSPVILYWQKGLSQHYKQVVLDMAKANNNNTSVRRQ